MAESRLDQALRQPDFIEAVRRDVQRLVADREGVAQAIQHHKNAFKLILERPELRVLGFAAGLDDSERARFWSLLALPKGDLRTLTELVRALLASTALYAVLARAWPNWVTGIQGDKPLLLLDDAPVVDLSGPLESVRVFGENLARLLSLRVGTPMLIGGDWGTGKSSVLRFLQRRYGGGSALLFEADRCDRPANDFRELVTTGEAATKGGAVFIDGLDRCRPEAIADVLELVDLRREGPNRPSIEFVVAGHRPSLVRAWASRRGHLEGSEIDHSFDRVFSFQSEMPAPLSSEVEAMVHFFHGQTLLGDVHLMPLLGALGAPAFAHPRVVKQCINRYQIFFDWGGFSNAPPSGNAVAQWLAISARWPEVRSLLKPDVLHQRSNNIISVGEQKRLGDNAALARLLRTWGVVALSSSGWIYGPACDLFGHIEDQLSRRGL